MADLLQGKSAKMWVNEICVKQLVQANYETTEQFPREIPPVFICRCVIKYYDKTFEATASGKTKKDAEQGAAREMLFRKMKMTPAKLLALGKASRKSTSTNATITATAAQPAQVYGENDADHNVSDTDDDALNSSINPIGELAAICAARYFDTEPIYKLVADEGPSHKKVFTVRCELKVPKKGIDLSFEGRRPKKQVAKKLAALRLLREFSNMGYRYQQYTDRSSNLDMTDGTDAQEMVSESEAEVGVTEEVIETMSTLSLETMATNKEDKARIDLLISSPRVGIRKYCDNANQDCHKFCSDYQHAFGHLKKSVTLDGVLSEPDKKKSIEKYGGEIPLLKQIMQELEASMKWFPLPADEVEDSQSLVFLQLQFPFKFKYFIDTKSTHAGIGESKNDAKRNAAAEALDFFKLMCIQGASKVY